MNSDEYDTTKKRDPAWTDRILFRVLRCYGLPSMQSKTSLDDGTQSLNSRSLSPDPDAAIPAASNGTTPPRARSGSVSLTPPRSPSQRQPSVSFSLRPPPPPKNFGKRPTTDAQHPLDVALSQAKKRFQFTPNNVQDYDYHVAEELRISDHRPVAATFVVSVVDFDRKAMNAVLSVCRGILNDGQLNEEDHL